MLTNRHVNTQVQESTTRYYSFSIGKAKTPESKRDLLETGISGNNTILRGDEKTALLERRTLTSSINTLLGELPHKTFQKQPCWECPTVGLK